MRMLRLSNCETSSLGVVVIVVLIISKRTRTKIVAQYYNAVHRAQKGLHEMFVTPIHR